MPANLLEASSRLALAAFLHDLGKFAERARLECKDDELNFAKQQYCPRTSPDKGSHPTHIHAAYTCLALDAIEDFMPSLKGQDVFPFGSWKTREADNSLINAAAMHHKPENFLQWIIATADRVASGFERETFDSYNRSEDKNHYQARQLSLFEAISLANPKDDADKKDNAFKTADDYHYRLPLQALSAASLFPQKRQQCEPSQDAPARAEYASLWEAFKTALNQTPRSHRTSLPLWLDHFDSCWQTFTHAIPSATAFGTKPDVSLYDHSHTTAALATALWRYHHEEQHDPQQAADRMRLHWVEGNTDWDDQKLLLIQGDFFGIQSFIFASGSETTRNAARLLRGRSLYVSLITECAALRILDALELPSTSQVTNAAGKFLIVAPNTANTRQKLQQVQTEFDQWFLQYSYGESGLGIASVAACCNDFVTKEKLADGEQSRFSQLMGKLFEQLEISKYQRLNLCGAQPASAVFDDYLEAVAAAGGVCPITGKAPATTSPDRQYVKLKEGTQKVSALAADQIQIGRLIGGKKERLAITTDGLKGDQLKVSLFGYYLHFTGDEDASGKFGKEVLTGNLRRLFDFSLPETTDQVLWNGYARRAINGYVPKFSAEDLEATWRYIDLPKDSAAVEPGKLKEFAHIACEDREASPLSDQKAVGIAGLGVLKGDVDNLGAIFQQGLQQPTFAKMAALSRQMNAFFSVYLPALCASEYPNTYTVFAGGDDFFLLGPWHSLMQLAARLRNEFHRYVAGNSELTFSSGIVICKPDMPVPQLARLGEDALDAAKGHINKQGASKNALHVFGQSVDWNQYDQLTKAFEQLKGMAWKAELSTGFIYSLLELIDLASQTNKPESGLWRSRLSYRAIRHLESKIKDTTERSAVMAELLNVFTGTNGIPVHLAAYRIPVTTYLYKNRD
jgi:CRISPR-associated protein Csm1